MVTSECLSVPKTTLRALHVLPHPILRTIYITDIKTEAKKFKIINTGACIKLQNDKIFLAIKYLYYDCFNG